MRTITTCPGIGDTIWLFMKLINQPEKFHWKCGDGLPQRAKQLFDLFPQLTESFEYIPDVMYKTVKRNGYRGKWARAPQQMYLEANSHLEEGKRIEKFLPDLATNYVLDYQTDEIDIYESERILGRLVINQETYRGDFGNKLIGIYTSAYSNARHWAGWEVKEWMELITLIQDYNSNYKFVFIGAEYDLGISEEIMKLMQLDNYINTIGQPLSVVVEVLKRLDCFIGFPSGLSIINETLAAKQTVMFYPKHLTKLINAWPDPARIESGAYKGCLFCEPKQIFDWLIENNKI